MRYTNTHISQYDRARVVVEEQSFPWFRPEFNDEIGTHPLIKHNVPNIPPPPPLDSTKEVPVGQRARAPRCQCLTCKDLYGDEGVSLFPTFSNYDKIEVNETASLTDHQALVSVSHVFGFVLKDRTYGEWCIYHAFS